MTTTTRLRYTGDEVLTNFAGLVAGPAPGRPPAAGTTVLPGGEYECRDEDSAEAILASPLGHLFEVVPPEGDEA